MNIEVACANIIIIGDPPKIDCFGSFEPIAQEG
jgi:hypothetical protein